MAKVNLRNVSKTYRTSRGGDVAAVRDVSLEIADREFVVLVGPAGCGKSSLLRMIAGLEAVSSGEMFIGDTRANDLPAKDRDIAMVFSSDALYPHLSVFDNLAFGLRRRDFSEQEVNRRVSDAAEVLGITKLLKSVPLALSPEERQRTALGRGLVRQPKVMLLDEPLAQLEPASRLQMRVELARLQQRLGTTFVYATHNPSEALALGNRIVVMNQGVVQQAGTAGSVYGEPANTFVAGFFGDPPMNLLRGTIKQERDSLVFREMDEGTVEVRLSLNERAATEDYVGKPILLGIRPEDVRVARRTPGGERSTDGFAAILDLVELRGAENVAHLQTGAHELVARTGEVSRDNEGSRVRFSLAQDRLHLFDAITKSRVS